MPMTREDGTKNLVQTGRAPFGGQRRDRFGDIVGNEPVVVLDISGLKDYAKLME